MVGIMQSLGEQRSSFARNRKEKAKVVLFQGRALPIPHLLPSAKHSHHTWHHQGTQTHPRASARPLTSWEHILHPQGTRLAGTIHFSLF